MIWRLVLLAPLALGGCFSPAVTAGISAGAGLLAAASGADEAVIDSYHALKGLPQTCSGRLVLDDAK